MNTIEESRRRFLKGCAAASAIGAVGPGLFFSGSAHAANGHDTVVSVFLRGGMDGLNVVIPVAGEDRVHYEQARPDLAIAASGTYGALPLTLATGSATGFGLHPAASGLRDLWNDGLLAIVQCCGLLTSVTRSHFDAQLSIDLGTPGQQGIGSGWLARALATQPGIGGTPPLPGLAVNSRQPANFNGSTSALTMSSPGDFELNAGAWSWQRARDNSPAGLVGVNDVLESMWSPGATGLEQHGARAERALRVIAQQPYGALPADWPTTAFARQLWTVAQSIQMNLGLRYATVDLGGWDTHEGQGTAGSGYHYFQNKIQELSQALSAFNRTLAASGHLSRVTTVVQSEFGRRVRENANRGTDHGYGNPMLVMGGTVNGRRLYGNWLGLDPQVLSPYYGDVPVTTDHRRVLSEILIRRMRNPNLGAVFPGYGGYTPLGLMKGTDLAPVGMAVAAAPAAVAAPVAGSRPRPASPRPPRPASPRPATPPPSSRPSPSQPRQEPPRGWSGRLQREVMRLQGRLERWLREVMP
ncbi:DUF1501 domain-containing protein [Marilutibacter chinensis]|uniref:DUF1501 domain-containing protein n=1 Tax=Marilutibacter chinensis TaxID=2912247 RepID=A0ABS9HWK3_9GAMM|nr:DUF1501 domain-containing protein [Lysobacter chinensis]MCF7223118.1 DUF1501 domain-containing protein [Lysobacter chinensis]